MLDPTSTGYNLRDGANVTVTVDSISRADTSFVLAAPACAPETVTTTSTSSPAALASTGTRTVAPLVAGAIALMVIGASVIAMRRRRA